MLTQRLFSGWSVVKKKEAAKLGSLSEIGKGERVPPNYESNRKL